MAVRVHFQSKDVHITLRRLKHPLLAAENVDFVKGSEPPCYHVFGASEGWFSVIFHRLPTNPFAVSAVVLFLFLLFTMRPDLVGFEIVPFYLGLLHVT